MAKACDPLLDRDSPIENHLEWLQINWILFEKSTEMNLIEKCLPTVVAIWAWCPVALQDLLGVFDALAETTAGCHFVLCRGVDCF